MSLYLIDKSTTALIAWESWIKEMYIQA